MAKDRRLVRLAPRPRELPMLVPDPRRWAAWQRWAQASDRRDAETPRRQRSPMGYAGPDPGVPPRRSRRVRYSHQR